MSAEIQFTSWNVRGLNKLVKLKQVMSWIRQLKAKKCFLDLRRCNQSEEEVAWSCILSFFSSHSSEVITLTHNSMPFHLINVNEDRFGRYLIIQCDIFSVRLNLVNLYPYMMTTHLF